MILDTSCVQNTLHRSLEGHGLQRPRFFMDASSEFGCSYSGKPAPVVDNATPGGQH